jgi:glutamyl-tRNA reductase
MSVPPPPSGRIEVVGLSHRTAPLPVREAFAFGPDEAMDFLARGRRDAAWSEALLLSTCNRTELYAAPGPAAGEDGLARRLEAARPRVPAGAALYREAGETAVRRLVRVACGLDSVVLGESEIAGQVREAHRLAREAGTSGPLLDRVVPAALRASARARAATGIARGPTSVPAAALLLARRHFAELTHRRVLVVGAGEAARLAAGLLAAQRPAGLWIANRTASRAEALAAECRAVVWPFDGLDRALAEMDLVVCATRAPAPLVRYEDLAATARRRAGRMLVLLDLGVPRNCDPRARDLEAVFLHDLDALEALVESHRTSREAEVRRVEALVDEAVGRLARADAAAPARALEAEIRRGLEALRDREVARSLRHFDGAQREHLDRLTRSLLDKALAGPLEALRDLDPADARAALIRRLLLPRGEDGDGEGGGGGGERPPPGGNGGPA